MASLYLHLYFQCRSHYLYVSSSTTLGSESTSVWSSLFSDHFPLDLHSFCPLRSTLVYMVIWLSSRTRRRGSVSTMALTLNPRVSYLGYLHFQMSSRESRLLNLKVRLSPTRCTVLLLNWTHFCIVFTRFCKRLQIMKLVEYFRIVRMRLTTCVR